MQAITRSEARREAVMMLRVVRGVNMSGSDEWFARDILAHLVSGLEIDYNDAICTVFSPNIAVVARHECPRTHRLYQCSWYSFAETCGTAVLRNCVDKEQRFVRRRRK